MPRTNKHKYTNFALVKQILKIKYRKNKIFIPAEYQIANQKRIKLRSGDRTEQRKDGKHEIVKWWYIWADKGSLGAILGWIKGWKP